MKKLVTAILSEIPKPIIKVLIPCSLIVTDILLLLIFRYDLLIGPKNLINMVPWDWLSILSGLKSYEKIQFLHLLLINIDIFLLILFVTNILLIILYYKEIGFSQKIIHYLHIPVKLIFPLTLVVLLDIQKIWYWLNWIVIFETIFVIILIKVSIKSNSSSEDQFANK